ncbi:MAG: uracil phosphoribosyltransferase [Bacteroidia bacterium]|nr:MAG: uracil phosphoribosyltransferase [Bacteroidia bacterium]
MIRNLGSTSSLLNQYIAELRDADIQKDSMRFRRNMERVGEIFAYEISKTMEWQKKEVVTSLGVANCEVLASQPVIATILRAGIPFHQGLLNAFDKAENSFVSAYRKHRKDGRFDVKIEYLSSPSLQDKTLIINDPMLATGASMVLSYKELIRKGKPSHTHIVSILASIEGLDHVKKNMPTDNYTLWVGAIDDELTAKAYIVPGLGDAGDLAFGSKL